MSSDAPEADPENEKMSWRDAAIVAAVLMIAQVFIVFLPLFAYGQVVEDPLVFTFDLFKFAGASFFGNFMGMAGLRFFAEPE